MKEVMIFSENGKDLKWGVEVRDHCWKCNQIFHKNKKIASLVFGGIEEIEPGYSWRKEMRSEDNLVFHLNFFEKTAKKSWEILQGLRKFINQFLPS